VWTGYVYNAIFTVYLGHIWQVYVILVSLVQLKHFVKMFGIMKVIISRGGAVSRWTLKMVAPDPSSKELGERTEWPKKVVNFGSKNLSKNILNLCKSTSPT
jgi:hypothetical protein